PLDVRDDRSKFTCGHEDLDRYFKDLAGQQLKRGSAGIQVAVIGEEIVGVTTTVATEIQTDTLPASAAKSLPKRVPVLRLARLAVSTNHQGEQVGKRLMKRTLEQALALRKTHGCLGVVVDSKLEAETYYQRFGFVSLEGQSAPTLIPMFLPMGTIEEALR
ncbi:MAG: GNAT family N-acetyltransferase, partial [Deltaproteobacteria bacterium]